MTAPRVLVSIVNWNGGEAIIACLETLYKSEFRSFSVVVIDNASSDASVDSIQRKFPLVTVVRSEENVGFCAGQNLGLRQATKQGFDYVWVLNGDTLIDGGALGTLVAELDAHPMVALASPVIMDGGANGGVQFCGGTIEWDTLSFRQWEWADLLLQKNAMVTDGVFLWGTAILARVAALAKMGELDERFFAYYEDIDLSVRAAKSGFQNRVVPAARIFHLGQNDPRKRPAHFAYFNTRNRALFWIKHLSLSRRPSFWRKYLAGALIYASTFKEAGDDERMNAVLLAIWDAMRGRGGRFDPSRRVPAKLAFLVTAHPYLIADLLRGNFASILRRHVAGSR